MDTGTINILKSNKEIKKTIIENVIKMLIHRKLIIIDDINFNNKINWNSISKYNKLVEDTLKQQDIKELYIIPIDNPVLEYFDGDIIENKEKNIIVKLNLSQINDFIKMPQHKFLILDKSPQGSNKIYLKNNIEFFTHNELLIDYMSHLLAPISCDIVSNKSEIENICNMWNSTPYNFPKIKRKSDYQARYFNILPSQIIKIIRSNKQTSQEIYYRFAIDE